jgi:hypothetical protein
MLPELQADPSALVGIEHWPVVVLQVPAVWHESVAGQVFTFPPTQVPCMHTSVCVHALPSLQVEPSFFTGLEQSPVPSWHVPGSWHWSAAVQADTAQHTLLTQKPFGQSPATEHAWPLFWLWRMNV